jgi:hypothetical protein
MRHAVVIASTRRPHVLAATLHALTTQSVPADEIVLSLAAWGDAPGELPDGVRVVVGPRGLTRQRNAGLDALTPGTTLVTFFDDDAEPARDYLERARAFAERHPEVVLFDGKVVADGAVTGEIGRERARAILAAHTTTEDVSAQPEAYGCNMTVRADVAAIVRFDERLPLYGWLEDRDFAVRCGRHGQVVLYEGCAIVHLGTSSGRISGDRMGFSQIVNPHYLWRKEVLKLSTLLHFWARALVGNGKGLVRRDEVIDRRGRLRGNLAGFAAVLRGLGPEAVLALEPPATPLRLQGHEPARRAAGLPR